MELIHSFRYKKRLERAWTYARDGNVLSIRFEGRRVHARVQGTDKDPYKVKLWLDVLNDEDWGYVLEALSQKARWSAQLLDKSFMIGKNKYNIFTNKDKKVTYSTLIQFLFG